MQSTLVSGKSMCPHLNQPVSKCTGLDFEPVLHNIYIVILEKNKSWGMYASCCSNYANNENYYVRLLFRYKNYQDT